MGEVCPAPLGVSKDAHTAGAESGGGEGGVVEVTGILGTSKGLWFYPGEDGSHGGHEPWAVFALACLKTLLLGRRDHRESWRRLCSSHNNPGDGHCDQDESLHEHAFSKVIIRTINDE